MEFLYKDRENINGRMKTVEMMHQGEILEWTISNYRSFVPNEYVFGDINRAIATLDESTQNDLWEVYQKIYSDMLEISNLSRLETRIVENLKRIEELLPSSIVSRQVIRENSIWSPPEKAVSKVTDVKLESFQDEDDIELLPSGRIPTGLTYSEEDLQHLNIMTIYLKLHMPVLSHFYNQIENETIDFFRASRTIQILDKTHASQLPGYHRLRLYIEHFWSGHGSSKAELSPSILLRGLSQDGAIDWIFSEIMFKRVLQTGVSHKYHVLEDNKRPSIIKGLFSDTETFSKILINGEQKSGVKTSHFMNKDGLKDGGDEESRSSTVENYKITSEIPETAIVINNHFLENIDAVIPHLDPTLDVSKLADVEYEKRHHKSMHPFRKHLIAWVMAKVVSPELIDYVSDKAYENMFVLTYSLLKHWGYDDLADIIDSHYDYYDPDNRESIFSLLEITAEQVKILDEMYPHHLSSNRVKGESKRNSNYVLIACTEMEDYVRGVRFLSKQKPRRWTCSYDVKYRLADLLIFMNNNQHI